MANVLLIRHGQASFGAADYDRLSDIGEEQARRLGAWFRLTGQAPDSIVTGRMQRHLRTAECCLEAAGFDAPRRTLAEFDEFDHADILVRHRPDLADSDALMEELARAQDPHRAFQKLYAAAVARWISGAFDAEYVRSWSAFRTDVLDGLHALASDDARTIWVFTSGGPIAVIANAVLQAPSAQTFALAWPLVNTSITRVAVAERRSTLVGYNAWPHMEGADVAHLLTHR